jgi:hypothetical protein
MSAAVADHLVELDDRLLDDRLRRLELERRRVAGEQALAIAVANARQLHLRDGHHSMSAYLRATLNCSSAEATQWKRLARVCDTVPGVADSLIHGRIGVGQAHELARARSNPRCGDRLREVAPLLLEQAEMLDLADFRTCVRRWELLADADGAHDDRERSAAARNASVLAVGGGVDVRASGGDPVSAAEMVEILDAFTRAEFDRDVAARVDRFGDAAAGQPLERTSAQRRFDALLEIFRRAANSPIESGRRMPVTVNLVVDDRTYAESLVGHGLIPDDALDDIPDPGPERRRCETAAGTPVHPDDVLLATIHGHVRRVVLDGAGVVTNLGRRRRLFTGAAREAARLSARRCSRPGCSIPSTLCEVDHVHDHAKGGATDAANGDPQCGAHNRQKNRGYRTVRDPHTGRVVHYRPDGTAIVPAGQAAPVPGHPDWRIRRTTIDHFRPLDLGGDDPPEP